MSLRVSITDICKFQGGSQPPKSEWVDERREGYIRMLQIRDFTQPDKKYIQYVKVKSNTKKCKVNDILIGRYGASIGKICYGLEGAYNVALIKTIPDERKLEKNYLKYILKSYYFQHFIQNIGSRAAQAGFNKDDLKDFKIPLPPLETQKRIAEILDDAAALRDKTEQLLEEYDALAQSIFLDMFGDPVINPKGWELENIKAISEIVTKGSSPKWQGFDYVSEGARFVTSENVRLGKLNINKDKFIPFEFYEKLKRSQLKENDLLVNLVGASIGRGALVTKEVLPANINQAVAKIQLKMKRVNPKFILHLIITQPMQERLIGKKVEGARANISLKNINELQFIYPPIELQNKFAEKIALIEKQKDLAKQELQESEDLFNALLQKAFKGELINRNV